MTGAKNKFNKSGFNLEGDADALLDRAYESEDSEEVAALVDRALELEPDNPEALLLLADLTADDEERLSILLSTKDAVRTVLDESGIKEKNFEEDELGLVYLALLQRAAFTFFSLGDDEAALSASEELLRHGLDDGGAVKNLYYRILIERQEWRKILQETEQDTEHQLGWAYARLAAAFMLAHDAKPGSKNNKNKGVTGRRLASMFWDALIMSPNVPFYMLGYFPEPEENASDEELEDFNFATLYADVWSLSRDLLNWFSRGVILFGLLSRRFGSESDSMLTILESLGGRAEYDAMDALIKEGDDAALIEMLAAHHCLSDALSDGLPGAE